MVQDQLIDLHAKAGEPFQFAFITSLQHDHGMSGAAAELYHAEMFNMEMFITLPTGVEHLYNGHGLRDGCRNADGVVVVVVAIFDPGVLGVGSHPYVVTASMRDGTSILSESGTITVEPADPDAPAPVIMGAPTFDLVRPGNGQVPIEVQEARLAICQSCPELIENICQQCSCFMPVKTGLMIADCPLHKWAE